MPIKPENLARYPKDWPKIRQRILARAGNCCERCKVANHSMGGRTHDGSFLRALPKGEKMLRLDWPVPGEVAWCSDGTRSYKLRIIRIVLTIAHLNHVIEECDDENLQALCQRCHLVHDAEHHSQTRYRTQREGRAAGDLFEAPT